MIFANELRHVGAAMITCAILTAAASPAQAGRIFYGTFNGDHGGETVANIGGADNQDLTQFVLIGSGNADLFKSGEGGVNCGAGFTSCLSLEATDQTYAELRTIEPSTTDGRGGYIFVQSGDDVTISFELSGNQRSSNPATIDRFRAGIMFNEAAYDLENITRGGAWTGSTNPPNAFSLVFSGIPITAGTPFQTYTLNFVAPQDMGFSFYIRGGPVIPAPSDGLGPILRSVAVDVASPTAVPEPATWALMIGGFGLAGGTLRRRRHLYA